MDRSLKERLVGAAVLVAIGAWLIPWVLDGPERVMPPRSTALELPTPAAENPPIRTETIVLERGDAPVAHAPAPSEDVAGGAPEPVPAAPEPVATPAPVQNQPVAGAPGHAAAPTAAAGETQWYVQLGAFGDRANAEIGRAHV